MKGAAKAVFMVCAVFLMSVVFSEDALAATVIVNTDDDVADSAGCDTAHCSFREALLAAEHNGGEDTIVFGGDYVISPLELLPVITEKLIIDGSGHTVTLNGLAYLNSHSITCPGQYQGDRSYPGLVFYQADNSKVTGMEIAHWCNGITVQETDGGEWTANRFIGNLGNAQLDFLYSNYNLTVGNVFWQDPVDPTPASGDQVELQHSSSNYFSGNMFTGGENAYELLYESNDNVIEREVIESCFRGAIDLLGNNRGNTIRNNHIANSVSVIVDGVAVLRGLTNGISLAWNADENVVEGNVISNVPDSGIAVFSLIAGTNDGNVIRGNTISAAGLAGVLVGGGTGNRLSENRISAVGGIGIDLSDQRVVVPFFGLEVSFPDGMTPNDSDLSANHGQNYPVMDEAKSKWNQQLVLLEGNLQGAGIEQGQRYDVECYGNPARVREAGVFLARKTVVANGNGLAGISIPVQMADPLGNSSGEMYVSCTASDANGNTSELSAPIRLQR